MVEAADRNSLTVRWRNFRLLKDTGDLELRPLTLIVGSNGSGKSSLLKPLLLMKQTLEDDVTEPALITRGSYTNCGRYRDCVPYGQVAEPLRFDLRWKRPIAIVRRPDNLRVRADRISIEFCEGEAPGDVVLNSYRVHDGNRTLIARTREADGSYSAGGSVMAGRPPLDEHFDRIVRKAVSAERPWHFLFTGEGVFPDALARVEEEAPENAELAIHVSEPISKYINLSSRLGRWVEEVFANLNYLGPLRALPERAYRMRGIPRGDIGVRGEYAPEVLHRALTGQVVTGQAGQDFVDRFQSWLPQLGFDASLSTGEQIEDMFSLTVQPRGRDVRINFADSAFGLSQLLPFLVLALRLRTGQMAIAEQPEIHLNPRLQAALADLSVDAVNAGGTLVIETHSEHIVTRTRTLVAEGRIAPEDVALYFVSRGPSWSTVRLVEIGEDGTLGESWPRDFFGDTLREVRLLSAAQRKWRKRTRSDE